MIRVKAKALARLDSVRDLQQQWDDADRETGNEAVSL